MKTLITKIILPLTIAGSLVFGGCETKEQDSPREKIIKEIVRIVGERDSLKSRVVKVNYVLSVNKEVLSLNEEYSSITNEILSLKKQEIKYAKEAQNDWENPGKVYLREYKIKVEKADSLKEICYSLEKKSEIVKRKYEIINRKYDSLMSNLYPAQISESSSQ